MYNNDMKIIIVSDSHGEVDLLRKIVNQHGDADVFLHLGDSQLPEEYLHPFVSVKGNGDYFTPYPRYRILKTPYGNFYCEHGHLRSRVSSDYVKNNQCVGYLYGHTHCKNYEIIDGVHYLNPGSLTRPRDGYIGSYVIMICTKEDIKIEFVEIN